MHAPDVQSSACRGRGRLLRPTSVEDGRLDSLCGLGQSSLLELAFTVELGSRSIFLKLKTINNGVCYDTLKFIVHNVKFSWFLPLYT